MFFSQQIVQTLIKCHILQHFILGLHCLSKLDYYSKAYVLNYYHLPYTCFMFTFTELRLWINTFSPYQQILFFPPQIYLKIKKWEKQEYSTGST